MSRKSKVPLVDLIDLTDLSNEDSDSPFAEAPTDAELLEKAKSKAVWSNWDVHAQMLKLAAESKQITVLPSDDVDHARLKQTLARKETGWVMGVLLLKSKWHFIFYAIALDTKTVLAIDPCTGDIWRGFQKVLRDALPASGEVGSFHFSVLSHPLPKQVGPKCGPYCAAYAGWYLERVKGTEGDITIQVKNEDRHMVMHILKQHCSAKTHYNMRSRKRKR